MDKEQIVNLIKNNFCGTILAPYEIKDHAEAIVLTGSYGRGTPDKFSDVDILVIVKDKSKFNIQGKYIINNTIFDFRTESENKIKDRWSNALFYALFNCYIILDRQNKLKKLIKRRVVEYKIKLSDKIAIELVELSVLFLFDDNWRDLRSEQTHLIKALKRDRFESVAYIENVILERIISLLYLVHFCPPADGKNRLYNLKKTIPIRIYKMILSSLLLRDFTKGSLLKRYSLLSKIVEYLKNEVDKVLPMNLDLKKIYLTKRE